MDMSRRAVRVSEKVFEACSECIKELEVVIPDYYPEVMKIVRTEAIPMVRQNPARRRQALGGGEPALCAALPVGRRQGAVQLYLPDRFYACV